MSYFFCLIAVARTFTTVLNRSDEHGSPGLLSRLGWNVFTAVHEVSLSFCVVILNQIEEVSFHSVLLSFYWVMVIDFIFSATFLCGDL